MRHYLWPTVLVDSPQCEDGAAVRLAGGLVYASRFALICRDGEKIVSRLECASWRRGSLIFRRSCSSNGPTCAGLTRL